MTYLSVLLDSVRKAVKNKSTRKNRRLRNSIARDLHEGRFGKYRPQVYEDKKRLLKNNKHQEHLENITINDPTRED